MSKESVTLPSVIPSAGIEEIIVIVGKVTGIYLNIELIGGNERVNGSGKVAKRIKRNLKRELGIDLDNSVMSAIGNAVQRHSLKDDNYLVEYTADLLSIVGQFSDDDSCFQEGHQNYHHLLAMNDPDANIEAFCIYRSDGRNMGRAWCFKAEDGAHVYFNAYGLHLDKIGKLASVLHNKPLREGYIRTNQDIWLNRGGEAYMVDGDSSKNNYMAELKPPDEYAPHQCNNCHRPIWNDNVFTAEDQEWCHSCYHRAFWNCERCQGQYRHDNDQIQQVHGSREYNHVCLTCAEAHYRQCDHCQRDGNTNWYMEGRLHNYTTREGNELHLCRDHHQRHVVCFECGNMIEPGTALTAYVNRYETRRACTQCVHDSNRIQYCTRCNDLTVDRYAEQCRRCGGYSCVSPVIALIVQENDETQTETDPADLVTEDVASGQTLTIDGQIITTTAETGQVWVSFDDGTTFTVMQHGDDRPAAMQNELDELLAELNEQLEPNNAPGPDPEPEPDNEPDPENLEGEINEPLIFENGIEYREGCNCPECLEETERRIAAGIIPPPLEIGF